MNDQSLASQLVEAVVRDAPNLNNVSKVIKSCPASAETMILQEPDGDDAQGGRIEIPRDYSSLSENILAYFQIREETPKIQAARDTLSNAAIQYKHLSQTYDAEGPIAAFVASVTDDINATIERAFDVIYTIDGAIRDIENPQTSEPVGAGTGGRMLRRDEDNLPYIQTFTGIDPSSATSRSVRVTNPAQWTPELISNWTENDDKKAFIAAVAKHVEAKCRKTRGPKKTLGVETSIKACFEKHAGGFIAYKELLEDSSFKFPAFYAFLYNRYKSLKASSPCPEFQMWKAIRGSLHADQQTKGICLSIEEIEDAKQAIAVAAKDVNADKLASAVHAAFEKRFQERLVDVVGAKCDEFQAELVSAQEAKEQADLNAALQAIESSAAEIDAAMIADKAKELRTLKGAVQKAVNLAQNMTILPSRLCKPGFDPQSAILQVEDCTRQLASLESRVSIILEMLGDEHPLVITFKGAITTTAEAAAAARAAAGAGAESTEPASEAENTTAAKVGTISYVTEKLQAFSAFNEGFITSEDIKTIKESYEGTGLRYGANRLFNSPTASKETRAFFLGKNAPLTNDTELEKRFKQVFGDNVDFNVSGQEDIMRTIMLIWYRKHLKASGMNTRMNDKIDSFLEANSEKKATFERIEDLLTPVFNKSLKRLESSEKTHHQHHPPTSI